ncbi:hypothetical protein L2E82_37601 [Cichorium intybus]|uniref:Uncharacterized protein n=1 Tax=Cichorium intybus TaxID=13427 RepID=A0ACB9AEY8_CICIN|nr:hypothetical protein L2E82_37601 [Cichorium intybus]
MIVSRNDDALPKFVRSKSSQELTLNSGFDSESTTNVPIWSKDKRIKSTYRWEQLRRNIIRPWYVDSGCSRHMTGDMSQLHNVENFNGRCVSFAGGERGKITQKGTVSNGVLRFENKECLILKPGVVIPEEWIIVRSERQNNAYIIDMNHNTLENATCLFSKASEQNAMLWHRHLGHANAKNLNRLAKNDLVQGLPIKDFITFEKCVACAQGKHHRKPHKPKMFNSIDSLLQLLHMDLFGPVNVLSINRKPVMKFITLMENQTNLKTKVIRCDYGTELKNVVLNKFCVDKGVQRQYSATRTPQQNGVAERRNRILIDVARTMMCDSKFTSDLLG